MRQRPPGIAGLMAQIAFTLYILLAFVGWVIATNMWDSPPPLFEFIRWLCIWVAIVGLVAYVVDRIQRWRSGK